MSKFKNPKVTNISSRSSSITNAFINGIIPVKKPSKKEIDQALQILGMTEKMSCSYCGGNYETWDHFEPIVSNKQPTGFISEIYNLIPSCNTCNSSKSGSYWSNWIEGNAPKSPKGRNKYDKNRIETIKEYEEWCTNHRTIMDMEKLKSSDFWIKHWEYHENILKLMYEANDHSKDLRSDILKLMNQLP